MNDELEPEASGENEKHDQGEAVDDVNAPQTNELQAADPEPESEDGGPRTEDSEKTLRLRPEDSEEAGLKELASDEAEQARLAEIANDAAVDQEVRRLSRRGFVTA